MKYFLLFFFMATIAQAAKLIPSKDNCKVYLILEDKHACMLKKSNYLVSYGYEYCMHFQREKHKWSENLKNWIENTAYCLQENIINYDKDHQNDEFRCKDLEKAAFASHSQCYQNNGFCKLSLKDQLQIVRNVVGLDILLKPKLSLQQALKVAMDCTKENLSFARCNLI